MKPEPEIHADAEHLDALAQRTFEIALEKYPESGKQVGIEDGQAARIFAEEIIHADHGPFLRAVENYSAEVAANKTPPQYVKRISNFMKDRYWRNYIEVKELPPAAQSPGAKEELLAALKVISNRCLPPVSDACSALFRSLGRKWSDLQQAVANGEDIFNVPRGSPQKREKPLGENRAEV